MCNDNITTYQRLECCANIQVLSQAEIYYSSPYTYSKSDIMLQEWVKDSSCFAYLWSILSLGETTSSPWALWVIIVISVQLVIHQHAPHKMHNYKGPQQEMRCGAGLQEQPFLITTANCHPLLPLVCHSFKQQCGRISLQTFEWICSGRTSCITCGTHDNYGRINTGGFMALLPAGEGCQIDTGLVFEQHTWVQTPTRL